MWIRSQDNKKIGDYKFFYISYDEIRAETNYDCDVLGKYKSSERALEVLSQLEEHVYNIEYFKVRPEAYQGESFIFQMPEK